MDDLIVEDFLVGAMSPEASLRWFRRSVRKAVILGGDRPDTALAALTTDTSVLILTGNLHPSTHVLVKADERGIPVILVPYDTFTAVRKVEGIVGKTRPKPRTIYLMKELIEKHVDWQKILQILKKIKILKLIVSGVNSRLCNLRLLVQITSCDLISKYIPSHWV